MTKTKSQLRAEAVERLRKLNCMDVDCYQLLEATVDDAGEKVGYRVEIRKLIDLLTDDAHEARGSYEERLHDVPVSDCPYCGCKRVVIYDFSDIYENPHSYRVEHVDEKEAFEAGCFESYYSFDSAEKAVEHANMRDTLTDEPMDARRDNDGTCPDADGTASNHSKNAPTLSDLYGILGGENSENLGQSQNSEVDSRENLGSNLGSGSEVGSEVDSREKLEAEIRYEYNGSIKWEADQIIEWLDRQAAITQDETIHDYNIAARECGRILRDEIAELKADNDCLRDRNEKLDYEVREWKGEAKTQRNNFEQATEARKHWQRKYETVKAERDELQERVDNLCASEEIGNKLIMAQLETEAEQGRTIVEYAERVGELEAERASWTCCYHIDRLAKLQAQRDRYRDLLSKAVDEAQAIVKLMEVER